MMRRLVLLISLLAGFACAYDLLNELQNCGLQGGSTRGTYSYDLSFNVGAYRIKELTINNGIRRRFFGFNQREGASMSLPSSTVDYEFTWVNDTRVCYQAGFSWSGCVSSVRETVCRPLPTWKYPDRQSNCYSQDYDGGCFTLSTGTCQGLYVTTLFETVVTKPARVINGFRISDCNGVVLSPKSDWLVVQEDNIDLEEPETKQQLVPINTNKFIQLMISVCPRTAVAINDIINSLNSFVNSVDLNTTYIALTVFDGALDYVDLFHFTNDAALINSSVANLKNYVLRDDTCNVRQSIAKKFAEVSAHLYGQPWDTLNFVIYSATGDLVRYISDDRVVVLPINRRTDISTYLIGQNLPAYQENLFTALGVRGYFKTGYPEASTQAFIDVARSINASSSGFNLFGYCSAGRIETSNTVIKMKYVQYSSSRSTTPVVELRYSASEFTPGCTAAHARDFCSPCSTVIDNRHIMCFECFNQSSVALSNATNYAQVLLRAPVSGVNNLLLPVPSSGAQFNVYIRFGGISNPLLYDYKFLAVSQRVIELPSAIAGDLIGVYIDWNGYAYNASLGIEIADPYTPPVTVPVAQEPIAAPVPQYEAPVSFIPPTVIEAPVAEEPIATPTQDVTPTSLPSHIPMIESPVAEEPIAVPVPQYEAPVQIPVLAAPVSSPHPRSEAPVSPPTNQGSIPISYPVARVPVTRPIGAPVSQPVAASPIVVSPSQVSSVPVAVPVSRGGPIATPQSATGAGTVADKSSNEDNVSSGVIAQSGLILVFATFFVAF